MDTAAAVRAPANPDFEAAVKAAVLSMPAVRHLGCDVGRLAAGEAEIIQPYRSELTEHTGHIQGGVLGTLADFAGGSVAGTLLPPGWVNKILAPAKGDVIIARGRVVNAGTTITTAAADVYTRTGAEETLCATALLMMRNIKMPGP